MSIQTVDVSGDLLPYNLINPYSVFVTRECRGIVPRINTLTGTEWGVPGFLIVYRGLVYSNEPIQPKSDLVLICDYYF